MNLKEGLFKKPVKVLQIFKIIHVYDTENKSFETRKEIMKWKNIDSKNGYVKDGELFLPEYLTENSKIDESVLITLEDTTFVSKFNLSYVNASKCFIFSNRYLLDIFEIKNDLDIHLKYDKYEVGIPARANFKLCHLDELEPIEIKINGKIDSTASRGRERMFREQQYIFQYLGDFTKYKTFKEPSAPTLKNIPSKRKVVDLIKPLW